MEFKVVISQLKQGKTGGGGRGGEGIQLHRRRAGLLPRPRRRGISKGATRSAAQEWIDSANRIYAPQQVTIYMDSFIEVGWVETLAL